MIIDSSEQIADSAIEPYRSELHFIARRNAAVINVNINTKIHNEKNTLQFWKAQIKTHPKHNRNTDKTQLDPMRENLASIDENTVPPCKNTVFLVQFFLKCGFNHPTNIQWDEMQGAAELSRSKTQLKTVSKAGGKKNPKIHSTTN